MRSTVLSVLALAAFACDPGSNGGTSPDPSEACNDMCDRLISCDIEDFNQNTCRTYCTLTDRDEERLPESCQDALGEVFACGAEVRCADVQEITFETLGDVFGDLGDVLQDCDDERSEAADKCDGYFGDD